MNLSDTIYALATPAAVAGVAIIRISGKHALAAAYQVCTTKKIKPRYAHFTHFQDEQSLKIDEGILLYFPAPASFTGEDVIEFQFHSSMASIRHMYMTLSKIQEIRLAEAGEFSRRAFVHGKLDLTELEGLADLLNAETLKQKALALDNLDGAQKFWFENQRTAITRTLASLEAYLDFPEEDIPINVLQQVEEQLSHIVKEIKYSTEQENTKRLRQGICTAIIGKPNAGKSSLLNALVNKDAAIVSSVAGTTRDLIEVALEVDGYPLTLIDTAGIRESGDSIEQEGIKRTLKRLQTADIVIILISCEELKHDGILKAPLKASVITHYLRNHCDLLKQGANPSELIVALTKSDLLRTDEDDHLTLYLANNPLPFTIVPITIVTENSVSKLWQALGCAAIRLGAIPQKGMPTRERHKLILQETLLHLARFGDAINGGIGLEIAAEELRMANTSLGRISGSIEVEEVLDALFGQFCIGK